LTYSLKGAWFQPLNLKCDILVSKFAFKFNLYRYSSAFVGDLKLSDFKLVLAAAVGAVCKFNPVVT
jgi:hypothetical protein